MYCDPIRTIESQVRKYSRMFPAVFASAKGSRLVDTTGKEYIDFFSGAGTLNYGHNCPRMKQCLIDYVQADGITHTLDMATVAKRAFIERFSDVILKPRGLPYKIQFTGPTGTNVVEAALKLARKVTGRHTVVHFLNSFHGMSLGSASVSGSVALRNSAGVPLHYSLPLFFDGDLGSGVDTLNYMEALLSNPENGVGIPAAVIVETVQAEGGIKVASTPWLQKLARITREYGILLIVDDIQVGCGRTGSFFSFEMAGIQPDLVCLSKAISGYGLPMSILLIRPELDIWRPGEHTGTFRGNNLAFVTGTEALSYWTSDEFGRSIVSKSEWIVSRLRRIAAEHSCAVTEVRGRGLILGIVLSDGSVAQQIVASAFRNGLLIETCGPNDLVLKLLPPLTISKEDLEEGLSILGEAFAKSVDRIPPQTCSKKPTLTRSSAVK